MRLRLLENNTTLLHFKHASTAERTRETKENEAKGGAVVVHVLDIYPEMSCTVVDPEHRPKCEVVPQLQVGLLSEDHEVPHRYRTNFGLHYITLRYNTTYYKFRHSRRDDIMVMMWRMWRRLAPGEQLIALFLVTIILYSISSICNAWLKLVVVLLTL